MMLHSGKINYAVQMLLGYRSPGEAMGYAEKEEAWCSENEKNVWKYMNSLKKEGYEIESVTRKGYRLLQSPDLLTREAVLSCIKKGEIPGELCCFESIDSTNEEAKRRGEAGAPDEGGWPSDRKSQPEAYAADCRSREGCLQPDPMDHF